MHVDYQMHLLVKYINRTAFRNIIKHGLNSKEIKMKLKNEEVLIVYELERIVGKEIIIPNWVKNVF